MRTTATASRIIDQRIAPRLGLASCGSGFIERSTASRRTPKLPRSALFGKHLRIHPPRPAPLPMFDASFLAQPLVDRQRESRLAPQAHLGWEGRAGSAGEDLLAAAFAMHEQWSESWQQMRVDEG